MQELDSSQLEAVSGGESFGQVLKAAVTQPSVGVGQVYQQTLDFIRDHPFFHEGLMGKSIGFGFHFRNVPFAGPAQVGAGIAATIATAGAYGPNLVAKGWETTRATLAAP